MILECPGLDVTLGLRLLVSSLCFRSVLWFMLAPPLFEPACYSPTASRSTRPPFTSRLSIRLRPTTHHGTWQVVVAACGVSDKYPEGKGEAMARKLRAQGRGA